MKQKPDGPILNGCSYYSDCFSCPFHDCIADNKELLAPAPPRPAGLDARKYTRQYGRAEGMRLYKRDYMRWKRLAKLNAELEACGLLENEKAAP